jgi:hypothetical protein
MTVIENIDIKIKKVISVLFRFIIVIYSSLILWKYDNQFDWYVYASSIVLYFIIFRVLYFRFGLLSFLRLLNDYLFILLILWNKPIDNIFTLSLLILPVINSLNHSTSLSKSRFSVALYVFTIGALYILNNFIFSWSILIAIAFLSLINLLTFLRTYVLHFASNLHDSIDKFYEENISVFGANKLLKNVLTELNKDNTFKLLFLNPSNIIALKVKKNKLILSYSAKFISTYEIIDEKEVIRSLEAESYLVKHPVIINQEEITNTIYTLVTDDNSNQYVYIILSENKLLSGLYVRKFLIPLFSKVSKVIEVEYELQRERDNYLDNIKAKMQVVVSTINAVHFLNNKFTPVTNYFSLTDRYEKVKDEEVRRKLKIIIDEEKKQATRNLRPVLAKFKAIRSKSLNPYVVHNLYEFSLYKVFSIIRKFWEESEMERNSFILGWDVEMFKTTIKINPNALEYVLDEIVENIKEHSDASYKVVFGEKNSLPLIIFSNDIRNFEKKIKELEVTIKHFNDEKTNEIMKRTSYGLTLIKLFLNQLHINYKAHISEKRFILELSFNPL